MRLEGKNASVARDRGRAHGVGVGRCCIGRPLADKFRICAAALMQAEKGAGEGGRYSGKGGNMTCALCIWGQHVGRRKKQGGATRAAWAAASRQMRILGSSKVTVGRCVALGGARAVPQQLATVLAQPAVRRTACRRHQRAGRSVDISGPRLEAGALRGWGSLSSGLWWCARQPTVARLRLLVWQPRPRLPACHKGPSIKGAQPPHSSSAARSPQRTPCLAAR